ncbi:hypothetical protein EMIT0111MI5_460002 [Burkholderia sp. IT-111MI5]
MLFAFSVTSAIDLGVKLVRSVWRVTRETDWSLSTNVDVRARASRQSYGGITSEVLGAKEGSAQWHLK